MESFPITGGKKEKSTHYREQNMVNSSEIHVFACRGFLLGAFRERQHIPYPASRINSYEDWHAELGSFEMQKKWKQNLFMAPCPFIKHPRSQIRCCFTWSVRGGSLHTKVSPALCFTGLLAKPRWQAPGWAAVLGTRCWEAAVKQQPAPFCWCVLWSAAGVSELVLDYKLSSLPVFKKEENVFSKKQDCFYMPLLYINHISTTENGKRCSKKRYLHDYFV